MILRIRGTAFNWLVSYLNCDAFPVAWTGGGGKVSRPQ
uniref:Uncharacterized protein n=1 Tax=Anguilla anguilla TaxID=7936 RepID=A0A0E9TQP6_ANGAN